MTVSLNYVEGKTFQESELLITIQLSWSFYENLLRCVSSRFVAKIFGKKEKKIKHIWLNIEKSIKKSSNNYS